MTETGLNWIRTFFVVLTPLLTLFLGTCPSTWLNRRARESAGIAAFLAVLSLGCAVLCSVSLARAGNLVSVISGVGPFQISLYYDNLSAILLLLISFLIAVITRYSQNYLEGDPEQGRFTRWLCLTAGSVQVLVISGNLLFFALAWLSVSVCLHHLLTFYPDRPGALLAARKKFIFSRLGDGCLLMTLILVYIKYQTWDFSELFRQSQVHPGSGIEVSLIGLLLVITALLKSAQFPFHSWLPDTMETPTPVSALMHAGIINAGGFLVMRLSPIIVQSPGALVLLSVLGGFTALFASLTMLTHASIKRALAFSTVAQMGFMMLECGLGAFSLAVLHLVAHSLYKAHAFLNSGSIIELHRNAWVPEGKPQAKPLLLAGTLAVSGAVTLISADILGVQLFQNPGYLFLGMVLWLSLGYMLWSLWNHSFNLVLFTYGMSLGMVVALIGFALHQAFELLLGSGFPQPGEGWTELRIILALVPLILFFAVMIFQTQMPIWSAHPICRALYVHARNGFYFTTLANRLVVAFWPTPYHLAQVNPEENHL